MSGALGRRAFSWGPPLLRFGVLLSSARIPLWLSCLHCVGLQHFGEWEGLSEQRALGWFRVNLVAPRVLPGVGAGSVARGEGLRCCQAAHEALLYLRLHAWPPFSVVICWGRALRARRWGPSRLQFIVSVCWALQIWACKRCWPIPSTL